MLAVSPCLETDMITESCSVQNSYRYHSSYKYISFCPSFIHPSIISLFRPHVCLPTATTGNAPYSNELLTFYNTPIDLLNKLIYIQNCLVSGHFLPWFPGWQHETAPWWRLSCPSVAPPLHQSEELHLQQHQRGCRRLLLSVWHSWGKTDQVHGGIPVHT